MLMPKRVKYRKQQRGRRSGMSKGATSIDFGEFGMKAMEVGWVTARQIEAARVALTRHLKRGGKVLGRRGQARPRDVRDRRRRRGVGPRSHPPGRTQSPH